MKNILDTLDPQFANSQAIVNLIEVMNSAIDPTADIENLYKNLWDINTCNEQGLTIWGIRVGVSQYLNVAATTNQFLFQEADGGTPFDTYPFRNSKYSQTSVYKLAPEVFRKLILMKAFRNISRPTIPIINYILMQLFGATRTITELTGAKLGHFVLGVDKLGYSTKTTKTVQARAFALDLGAMQLRYVFNFMLKPWELAIITQSGVVPKPAGVQLQVYNSRPEFGFSQANMQPFGQAPFRSSEALYVVG